MKLEIQSIHFDASQELLAHITKRAQKLELHYANILYAEVFLKAEKPEIAKNKMVEIRIHIPGRIVFAQEYCSTFEQAADLAIDSLIRQLEKNKTKLSAA